MTVAINEAKKIVIVEFNSSYKQYEFKNDIEGLEVGDIVVVDAAPGISIGTVTSFKDDSKVAMKWVIQKVDLVAHNERLAREKKLVEIKAKMELRRKKLQEIEIYQILAKEDKDMAALLEEYQGLN